MGRYFIDCEFDGHGGPLLSFGVVSDDGDSLHVKINQEASDPWVVANVVPLLDRHEARKSATVDPNDVGGVLKAFIGPDTSPHIIADSPVDIGRFCQAISTGSDGGWASTDYPEMTFTVVNIDCYPTVVPGAMQHNAFWDALALAYAMDWGDV